MEIQLAQIIFQIINFGVVLAALTYFVYKPVVKLLEDRKSKIAAAAISAAEIEKSKAQLEEVMAKGLQKAKAESKRISDDARRRASQEAKDLLEKTKLEIKAREAKFEQEMATLRQERLLAVESEIKQAAFRLAEIVLSAEIDQKKHTKVIDEQLKRIIASFWEKQIW